MERFPRCSRQPIPFLKYSAAPDRVDPTIPYSLHSPFPSLLLHRSSLNGPPVLRPEVRAVTALHVTVISKFETKQRLVDKA